MERRRRQCTPVGTGVPWLVFTGQKDQTFCTIGPTTTTVELKTIPELRTNYFWVCLHGWLLLSSKDHHLWSLWNPTTYELITLTPPPSELIDRMKSICCIFTASPKNPRCAVMIFDSSSTALLYCQPGDQHWKAHDYKRDLLEIGIEEDQASSLFRLICLDGVVYAEGLNIPMVAIEFDNQTSLIKIKSLGLGRLRTTMFTHRPGSFLVESFGEIYSVQMQIYLDLNLRPEHTFGIEVFRMDFSRKMWVEIEDLDGRLIFLDCQGNCTSCLATETGMRGNQIYFMIAKDKHLYVYDLEDGTILNSLPCPRLQTPWDESFWVLPEYLLIDDQVNVKPEYKISMALKKNQQHTKVEVQSPRDMEASSDQYPPYMHVDSFTEIASKLGPLDYLEFRASCRLFRSAAPATQRSFTSITSVLQSPWLVTFRYNKTTFSFTDPKQNKTYSAKVPESLQGTYISSSKDGYLVLVDGKNVFYFNPFTRMQVKLPEFMISEGSLSFSSSPVSAGCLALMLDSCWPRVYCIRQGKDAWDVEEFEGNFRGFGAKQPGVFHKGMFYFLGEKWNVGVLKIDGDEFSLEVLVKLEVPCNAIRHAYLMKCNGELMTVFLGQYGNWVKVYRLDLSTMIWVRVRSLGYYTLYISNISSFAAVARSPGMENKIYFSRFYDQRIIYYSLDTEKFHTHGNDVALDNFVDTKEQLYCTWIESSLD